MFGELRQLLHGEQDWATWWSICALLDVIADPQNPRYEPGALDYAAFMVTRWPDAQRILRASARPQAKLPPHAPLVRNAGWYRDDDQDTLRAWWATLPPISVLHTDCASALLSEQVMASRVRTAHDLLIYEGQAEEALELLERHQPALHTLRLLWLSMSAEHTQRLLKLDCAPGLRTLELDLSFEEDYDADDEDHASGEIDGWVDTRPEPGLGVLFEVARCERLSALDALHVGGGHQTLDLHELCDVWRARRPSALTLSLCTLSAGSFDALGRWGYGLQKLSLGHMSYDTTQLTTLLSRTFALPRLSELGIPGRSDDLRPLLRALGERQLKILDMNFNALADPNQLAALAQATSRHTLRELRIGASEVGPAAIAALCAQRWPALEDISMWNNPIGEDGAQEMTRTDALYALRRLYAPDCQFGDEGLAHLATGLPALTSLRVAGNRITDRGVEALLASAMAARLLVLDLDHNKALSVDALDALLDPAHTPALLYLNVSRTAAASAPDITERIERARHARPWLRIEAQPAAAEDEDD
jgi:hypothetical protein